MSFLIGPVFFVLLETSITKGPRHAIFLDIGVLLSDILYLLASFYVAKEINEWLTENSFIKYIAGSVFIVMGVVSIIKNRSLDKTKKISLKEVDSNSEINSKSSLTKNSHGHSFAKYTIDNTVSETNWRSSYE